MIRGIRSAANGMMAQMINQDVAANNLANANTAGFKQDKASFEAVLHGKLGAASISEVVPHSAADFTQGTLLQTENPFNLALDGEGFFTVRTQNELAYTRNGSFTRDSNGYLVTQSGEQVLGNSGPIQLNTDKWTINEKGQIYNGKTLIDTLQITQFNNPSGLTKVGSSLWKAAANAGASTSTARVCQGYLEGSNVNTISEMVSMISGYRVYEAGQKAVQAQDETLDKAVNDVGRVS
jgi:flagellar basal-body rod protein FlgG